MDKNTFLAIFLSTAFLIVWFMFFQPKPAQVQSPKPGAVAALANVQTELKGFPSAEPSQAQETSEREITVETANYKAVFTTQGAAVKHWFLKDKSGTPIDLVHSGNISQLATFPGSNFDVDQPEPLTLVFTHSSPLGWRVKKTFKLTDGFLHTLNIQLSKIKNSAQLPAFDVAWGPGLGTELKEQKDNEAQTRALALSASSPFSLEKMKPGDYPSKLYHWAAIDNRYFLAAFIPIKDTDFANLAVARATKKLPPELSLRASAADTAQSQDVSLLFYLGPKGHEHLKSFKLNLEETVDFGYFGFLGKLALGVLNYFYKMTGNYGWAIIILTVLLQIIVLPLTVKSFKASAAMKQLQPLVKELQDKYKADPKRLNVEMLNLYKVHKVNPLGGCLPMLLQLPIFWALFTTLRNAIELRGAHWILWVKDLSAPDTLLTIAGFPINILPLIMGVGMFFQQQMMSVSTDPAQQKLMYMMPVLFTFMFWNFPSGLVIYWLTNSILTMTEQYFIMKNQPVLGAVVK